MEGFSRVITSIKKFLNQVSLMCANIVRYAHLIGYDLSPEADQIGNVERLLQDIAGTVNGVAGKIERICAYFETKEGDPIETLSLCVEVVEDTLQLYKDIKGVAEEFRNSDIDDFLVTLVDDGRIETFLEEFSNRLIGKLVADYLSRNLPLVYGFTTVSGLLRKTKQDFGDEYRIDWGNIAGFLKNPHEFVQQVYQWGSDGQTLRVLLERLNDVMLQWMIPSCVRPTPERILSQYREMLGNSVSFLSDSCCLEIDLVNTDFTDSHVSLLLVLLPPTDTPTSAGIGLTLLAATSGSFSFPIGENVAIAFDGGAELAAGMHLALLPGSDPLFRFQFPSDEIRSSKITISYQNRPAEPIL